MNHAHALAAASTGTQQGLCRVADTAGQGSRHTRLSILCCGNQPHVTEETETGKVLQRTTTDCMQKPEIQEDQRSGMDEKCFEHRKIRG